jgi:hypothetical protein
LEQEAIPKIKSLLTRTTNIVQRQEELKKLRGENFNIFSILNMESKENATHSAFLGELLNPMGSHLFGTVFLRLYLETIGFEEGDDHRAKGELELDSTVLTLEKHVGARDDKEKTGGRIDIYLSDAKGNSISIENKIYASDQYAQIERYVNHNKGQNTVYYLTLNGEDASKESKGKLKDGSDYHCISYRDTVVTWLDLCMKEAADQPILRESIKQYILLIKKLTNQLSDNKMQEQIAELIKKDYQAAKAIQGTVWQVEVRSAHNFLNEIKEVIQLQLKAKDGWEVLVDKDMNESWSGLSVKHISWGEIRIGIEGRPKVPWSASSYGIFAHKGTWDRNDMKKKLKDLPALTEFTRETAWWPYFKDIFSLETDELRVRLFDEVARKVLVEEVATTLRELAQQCQEPLATIKRVGE